MASHPPFIEKDINELAQENKLSYLQAKPFPNISFVNFFDTTFLDEVLDEFPDLEALTSKSSSDFQQLKFSGNGEKLFGIKTKQFMHFLNSEPFLHFLQELTGIEEKLVGDPYFKGGGQHEIKRGGLLKIHADFNKHPTTNLDRRLNVLVYLNKDWKEDYGGHFELWDKDMTSCAKKIAPLFNTIAIFSTTNTSFHGHPDPLNCPDDRSRKSLALYYYTNGRPEDEIDTNKDGNTTYFQARSGNEKDVKAFSGNTGLKKLVKELTPPILYKGIKKLRK